jgi:hypothetical protein
MSRGWLLLVLALVFLYVTVIGGVAIQRRFASFSERFYRLQAVSIGMSRSAVIARLGEPNWVDKSNEFIEGESEVLIYASSTGVPDDLWVILDKNARVASVLYPDIGELAKGEIAIGDAASRQPATAR